MAENRKFRVAMIGAGGRANSVIYPSLADLEDVEFVGICDIDKERLNETAISTELKSGTEIRCTTIRE